MHGINILICTTDFNHTPRHSRSGIHYSCTALSAFINETSQQWNFPGINLQTKLYIDLVVLLMCSDKSFLISQTICDAHLLHMYVPGPLNESAKVGKQCVWSYSRSLTCKLQSSDSGFTIEFHWMHILQNLLIYFNILVINTWKQLK